MTQPWKVLLAVSVAVFMASLDLFIVNIAFPDIAADFSGASVSSLSWVLNAYAIVVAALLVPLGRLADRVGRRRIFLAGLCVFLVGSALCGAAQSESTLVVARVIQATGAAALMPTSLALLLVAFPPAQRTAAIGVWAAVGGVAAAAGPPLGGLLVEASWRLVFLVNLPVGVAALAYAWGVLAESRDESEVRRPDLLGTALLIVAIGALALGLVKAPAWGWTNPKTLAALAGAGLGLALFIARCRRHPAPVLELEMLRVRSFAAANTAALSFFASFAAMLLSSVLFLTLVWDYSVLQAGLAVAPGPAMAAIFAVPSSRVAGRIGFRNLIGLGGLLFGLGALWRLAFVDSTPDYGGAFLPSMLIGGAGVGLILPALSSVVAASLPPTRFATGSAVLAMSRQIGAVLGVALLVAVIGNPTAEDPGSFDGAWQLILVTAIVSALAGFAVGRTGEPVALPATGAATAKAAS